jgi:hypothetical protein
MSSDAILNNFVKTNRDRTYKYTTMLRHKGTVIAFAMDDARHIWYSVLDLSGDKSKSPLDVNYWVNPQALNFPYEIAEVGFGVADQTRLPVFKKGSNSPEEAGDILPPSNTSDSPQYDYFRSTTARLSADAPSRPFRMGIMSTSSERQLMARTPIWFSCAIRMARKSRIETIGRCRS